MTKLVNCSLGKILGYTFLIGVLYLGSAFFRTELLFQGEMIVWQALVWVWAMTFSYIYVPTKILNLFRRKPTASVDERQLLDQRLTDAESSWKEMKSSFGKSRYSRRAVG